MQQKRKNKSIPIQKKLIFQGNTPQRIDVFVASNLQQIPRKKIQQAIKEGKIKLNDKVVQPRTKVQRKELVSVNFKIDLIQPILEPQANINISIIKESDDFIIIDKPSGISVHPGDHQHRDTVANWILARSPQIKDVGENPMRPGIVHRLDKETSGVLIIAKNQKSYEYFKNLFSTREIVKIYHALCWGTFQKKSGQIQTFIGKSRTNPLKQATSANEKKLINPKTALTSYMVTGEQDKKSLVKVIPKTGRKHQIRIHLQSIAHPIVGDKLYSIKEFKNKNKQYQRLMLHAQEIRFEYLDGKSYIFNSILPDDFKLD